MYASKVGRFLQPDPLAVAAADSTNPQSLNMYSYVGNDPVNFVDPDGLLMILLWGDAVYDLSYGRNKINQTELEPGVLAIKV